jgi:hypothetical protein
MPQKWAMQVQQVTGTHQAVMGRAVVLGKIVRKVVRSSSPVHVKILLVDAVADPIEAHINGLRSTLFIGVVGDSSGT